MSDELRDQDAPSSLGGVAMGIWDGHDCGVAVVDLDGGEVLYAANEERFTRSKLDVGFPEQSFREAIERCGEPSSVAISTTDPSKLLSRLIPSVGREYYLLRRHKRAPRPFDGLRKRFKAVFTMAPPLPGCAWLTRRVIARRTGLSVPIIIADHHTSHLAAAFFTSGFESATVLSLDGVGDASSGACAYGGPEGLTEVMRIKGRNSIALLYEEATRLLSMRELEDEGKVMALSAYADLGAQEEGCLDDLIVLAGESIRVVPDARKRLEAALWKLGPERFAAAVQRMAERAVMTVASIAVEKTGIERLCVAGGLFSNVRINRMLRERLHDGGAEIEMSVFPHMGDGGLALGAIIDRPVKLQPYLGTAATAERAADVAREMGLGVKNITVKDVAKRIAQGSTVGWVNGRMEYGPRALGARSIIARPDDPSIRDRLNLAQKKRVFYQPFCPTMTLDEAKRSLARFDGRDERWMTSLYGTTSSGVKRLAGVTGPDGSCRPQILTKHPETSEEKLFHELLCEAEKLTGIGAVLNTSFNIHGDPIVRTERDAIDAFLRSGLETLVFEGRIEILRTS